MKTFAASSLLLVGSLAFADTLTLKNGRVVDGTFNGGDSRMVRMVVGSRVETFNLNEVDTLRFGSLPAPASINSDRIADRSSDRSMTPPPASREDRILRPDNYEARNTPPARAGAELAAGTVLSVRMIDDVDSQRDRVGQTFRATVDEPVYLDGRTVIPRGSDVVVKLVDAQQSGKFEGKTSLTLDLVSIRVDGRDLNINTSEVRQDSASRGQRTTKVVGGTAALGAIIGAIAGGGKGAAIGAASGAGVGAGAQTVTKNQTVKIPSETRLSFTLQQPLSL